MTTDLSGATITLRNLISNELLAQGETMVTTSSAPPDRTPTTNNTVSVYLFHLMESPHFKNAPPIGRSDKPIQQAPMGLVLQYIITVVHDTGEEQSDMDSHTEQRLLGRVARAIHDFPVITPNTKINGVPILDVSLADQNNTVEFNLRPATMEETISFWTAEETRVPRLSLFVEARVVVLAPKEPTLVEGVVLTLGNFVLPNAGPQLTATRSIVRFRVPASISPDIQQIQVSPARGSLFPTSDADPSLAATPTGLAGPGGINDALLENNRVLLEGVNFAPGARSLVFKRDALQVKVEVDDALANPTWEFAVGSGNISFRVRRDVVGTVDGVPATSVALVPGIYSVRLLLGSVVPGGPPRSSNAVPLTVSPQVLSVFSKGGGVFAIQVVAAYIATGEPGTPATADEVSVSDILLSVRGIALSFFDPAEDPSFGPGHFRVFDASTLEFMLPASITDIPGPTNPMAVTLVMNGASATPAWLEEAP